jgi:hypothetical protein
LRAAAPASQAVGFWFVYDLLNITEGLFAYSDTLRMVNPSGIIPLSAVYVGYPTKFGRQIQAFSTPICRITSARPTQNYNLSMH